MPSHQELSMRYDIRIGESLNTSKLADDDDFEFVSASARLLVVEQLLQMHFLWRWPSRREWNKT
jgi:hypothetical protein